MSNVLEYQLRLADAAFTGPLGRARDQTGRFQRELGGLGAQSGSINSLGGAFTGLAGKIGAAFTAYKVLQAGMGGFTKSLGLASAAETTATAFKTMLGSASAAQNVLSEIKKLGAETPFEFPELANAGKMLLAFGEAAEAIPETLRRIGDIASGVGAPIGEIAEIYGKARTAGTLFSEDINQLTGRGIPIIKAFAQILKEPESAIKKLAEEGKITFPLLEQAFQQMTSSGGQFFGMMAEQSKTSAGMWSTLQDSVNELYLKFGEPLNDAIKPVLTDAIALAGQLTPLVEGMGASVATMVTAMRNFVAEAQAGSGLASAVGESLLKSAKEFGNVIMIPIRALGAGAAVLGQGLWDVVRPVGEYIYNRLDQGANNFTAALMRGVAEALDAVPGLGGAAKELRFGAQRLEAKGANSQGAAWDAEERANRALGGLPSVVDTAMGAIRDSWTQQLTPPDDASGLPKSVLDKDFNQLFPGGTPSGLKDDLPKSALAAADGPAVPGNFGLLDALPGSAEPDPAAKEATDTTKANTEATSKLTEAIKAPRGAAGLVPADTGTEATSKLTEAIKAPRGAAGLVPADTGAGRQGPADADDRYDADGRRKSDGRRKIERRKVDGPRDYSLTPYSGSIAGPDAGMRGNLNRFYARQSGLGGAGAFTRAPNVPSPGAALRGQQQREAATTAVRASGGSSSGGGSHPLAAVLKDIQTKLNSLAVAT
jgi:hypothetical protein